MEKLETEKLQFPSSADGKYKCDNVIWQILTPNSATSHVDFIVFYNKN